MPIEVTCPGCGKVLRVKESLAGKSGKCPQCGKAIRVPEPAAPAQQGQPMMTAHVVGIKVRGGVKKEEVPLRGTQMVGFGRRVIAKPRVAPQATLGLVLAIAGVLLALAPTVPNPLNVGPVLGLAGGLAGALGAALAGWGLLNILQMSVRYRGKGVAFAGLGVGVVAFVVGLMVFTGKGGGAGAAGSIAVKRENLNAIKGQVEAAQKAAEAAPATSQPDKAPEEPAPVSRRAPAAGGESAAPSPAAGQPEKPSAPAPEAPEKLSAPAQETGPAQTPAPSPEAAQPEKPAAPSEGATQPEKPVATPSE